MTSDGEVDLEAAVEPAESGGVVAPAGSGGTGQGSFRRVRDLPAGRVLGEQHVRSLLTEPVCQRHEDRACERG